MPYKASQIPSGTETVPAHGQAIYRAAFNSAHSGGAKEAAAHAIAWSAVKRVYRKKGDRWVSKDGAIAMSAFDKEFSAKRRETLAKSGAAMPHGGFPIESEQDLKNAIKAVGRAKNPAAAKAHIKKRARALGKTELLPENWDAEPARDARVCPTCKGEGVIDDDTICPTCKGEGYIGLPSRATSLIIQSVPQVPTGSGTPGTVDAVEACPDCDGTGFDDDGEICETCGGKGYLGSPEEDGRTVDTPARQHDSISLILDRGVLRKSKDGYLVASARIARTGIQLYDGVEVGRPDLGLVRVYRPPEEVFSRKAMLSLAHKPITLEHPHEMVDAANWDKYAIGHIGDEVTRDGDSVRVPMVIMDGNAIRAYERDGVKELSVGYSTELKWGKGTTPDGETYDAVQTAIRGNHLAVVPAARGGSQLRLGDDHQRGEKPMVKVLIDGQSIEFDNELAAKHVQDFIASLQADAKKKDAKKNGNGNGNGNGNDDDDDDAEEEQEAEKKTRGAKDAAFAALTGENAALKKQLEDAQAKMSREAIDAAVKEKIDLLLKADAVMEGKGDFEGKEPVEIRRAVVLAKMGDAAKSLSDAEMVGAFKILTANLKPRSGTDRLADSLALLGQGGAGGNANDPKAIRDAAYEGYVDNLKNAWKKPRASA